MWDPFHFMDTDSQTFLKISQMKESYTGFEWCKGEIFWVNHPFTPGHIRLNVHEMRQASPS